MHLPRAPAFSQGTAAFLWALALGGFVFIAMLAIAISMETSIVTGILSGAVIFAVVRTFGANAPGRERRSAKSSRRR